MPAFKLTRALRLTLGGSTSVSGNVVFPSATSFALSGPTTGTTGVASTFTVAPNGPLGSTVIVTISAPGATTSVGTLTFTAGSSAGQTFTVTRATDGTTSVSITNNGGLTNTGTPISLTTAAANVFASFAINSAVGGSDLPFAFGHAFKDGDVGASQVAIASGATDWQCTPLTYWPSGCVRHAIVAGRATCIAGADKVLPLTAGTAPTGTTLSETDLSVSMPATTVEAGAFVWDVKASVGTADRVRTVCAGLVMSNFIYRKQVTGSNHLVLWADVRIYRGGAVEVFPWVENGFLTSATTPTNESRVYKVTMGGVERFNATIDVKHHTRIPLVSGSTFSHWSSDPQIVPKHDRDYLMETKLVPQYGYTSPATSTLNGLLQSYTPNTLAGISSSMGVAGSSTAIINNQQAYYITSGADARAYRSAIVFGLSGGSWSTHYRDATTHDILKFTDYPSISLQGGGTPAIAGGSGGENGTPVTTHQPSYGYLPFLITARWFFFEESAFWVTWNYAYALSLSRRGWTAYNTAPYRYATGSAGVIDPSTGAYAHRGAHWSMSKLAQTLALCPSSHAIFSNLKAAWEANTDYYRARFVDGTFAPGWVSPMGMLGEYSGSPGEPTPIAPNGSTAWWGNVWMANFGAQVWGFASNLDLPQSAQSALDQRAVRDHAFKGIVARAGDGLGSNHNWRRVTVFKFPWGTDGTGLPPEALWTPQQAYAEYTTRWSLPALDPALGGSLRTHMADDGLSGDADMTAGSSAATDYFPMALSALAYAVDHGAPNAAEGWERIASASNYSAVTTPLSDNPGHGLASRKRAALEPILPPAGQFANISLNTLNDAKPSGWPTTEVGSPFINWVGGQWGRDFGEAGGLVIHGSGHLLAGAPLFAGVWIFDLATRKWVGRNVPSAPLVENSDYNSDAESTAPATLGHTYPPHTYDGNVYIPAAIAGNKSGKLAKNWWPGTPYRNSTHVFDLDSETAPPVREIDEIAMGGSASTYPMSALDEARGGYWLLTANGAGPLKFVNAATWAVTNYPGIAYGAYGDHSLIYIPSLDCLVGMGRGDAGGTIFKVFVCPIVSGVPQGFTEVFPTGTIPTDGRCGGQWSEWHRGIICYVGDGATGVQRLSPPASGSLTAGTWTWTSQTLTGVGGVTPGRPGINTNNGLPYAGNGTWGRFVEVDYMPGVFLWASSMFTAVQAWHLDRNAWA